MDLRMLDVPLDLNSDRSSDSPHALRDEFRSCGLRWVIRYALLGRDSDRPIDSRVCLHPSRLAGGGFGTLRSFHQTGRAIRVSVRVLSMRSSTRTEGFFLIARSSTDLPVE
jgi:hypothetical protein